MFASNQELTITGSMSQLKDALIFAMRYSGQDEHLSESERKRGCKVVYQIAGNKYAIGWGFGNVPAHWKEWDFDFDYDIVSRIIEQFIQKNRDTIKRSPWDGFDGSSELGFKMENIKDWALPLQEGLQNGFYGIVSFEPYWNFYAK